MNLTDERICHELSSQGWSIIDDFFSPTTLAQLTLDCQRGVSFRDLHQAGVGRGSQQAIEVTIRGDQIQWLEAGMTASTDSYLESMTRLRLMLNQKLFLGLESNENHVAKYPPGAFYQRHLDRFRDNDSRTVSSVFYMNPDWQPGHGGELRLHLDGLKHDISPLSNRLVLFISADIWHEVLPTHRIRWSLTGWFKRRQ